MRTLIIALLFITPAIGQDLLEVPDRKPIAVKNGDKPTRIIYSVNNIFKPLDIKYINNDIEGWTVLSPPPGSYLILANNDISIIQVTSSTDPTDPVPPTDPNPPTVPTDDFDNIGQEVASKVKGLSKNKELASVFKDYSNKFIIVQSTDITTHFDNFNEEVNQVIGGDTNYDPLRKVYFDYLSSHWADWQKTGNTEFRKTLSEYFEAIANGLEAAS